MANERMNWLEVEERIEKRIAEESEIYDLDSYDIAEIRLETYKECGWDYDAGKDEDEEEEEGPQSNQEWISPNDTPVSFPISRSIILTLLSAS